MFFDIVGVMEGCFWQLFLLALSSGMMAHRHIWAEEGPRCSQFQFRLDFGSCVGLALSLGLPILLTSLFCDGYDDEVVPAVTVAA